MRRILLLLLLTASTAFAADTSALLNEARRAAAAGYARLALEQVVRHQPQDAAAPLWNDWEALRCRLSAELDRHQVLLARVPEWTDAMPAAPRTECLAAAARSAAATGAGALARELAGRALWSGAASSETLRLLRLTVIDSYVADRRGDDALGSMLRYQQDYRPLDRAVATRFVEALLDLGREKDAVNWLALLDDAGPLKLLLRLRTGLAAPQEAIAQARAAAAKTKDPGHWRVIAEAAQRLADVALAAEAAEQLLNQPVARPDGLALRLWELYLAAARDAANRSQLLMGDDVSWADLAARRAAAEPAVSRALFGHLARHAAAPESRRTAQLQLVYSLRSAGLDRVALRLADAGGLAPGTIDPQARFLLGAAAESLGDAAATWRYWEGLDTPAAVEPQAWHLRLAAAAFRAGAMDAATGALKGLAASRRPVDAKALEFGIQLGTDMLNAGRTELARDTVEALLPYADPAVSRRMHVLLGRIYERAAQPSLAAHFFLRAALLSDALKPDAVAIESRLLAGLNLARAGQRDEARVQLEWVMKNAKDAAMLEAAGRELARP